MRSEPMSGEGVARTAGLASLVELWVRLPQFVRALVPIAGGIILWFSSAQEPDDSPYSVTRALFHNTMHVVAYGCLAASVWLAWSARPACQRQDRKSVV